MLHRRRLLLEAADGLATEVVEQAQAAITRDMAFFAARDDLRSKGLEGDEGWKAMQKLGGDFEAGDLEVSPEALEAACIMVDLLLGE